MGLDTVIIIGGLVRVTRFLTAASLVASVALNFANIVGRYFFDAPIEWAEEVMLFLMVATVFLGVVSISWDGRHISMELLTDLLPPGPRNALRVVRTLIEIAAAGTIAYLGVPIILRLIQFDQRSEAANLPLAIPQALVPLGLTLLALVTAVRLLRRRKIAGEDTPEALADRRDG